MSQPEEDFRRIYNLRAGSDAFRKEFKELMESHRYLIDLPKHQGKLSRSDLEEAYQDTFFSFYKKELWHEFKGDSSLSTYIAGIFSHKISDRLRKKTTNTRKPQEHRVDELDETMAITIPEVMEEADYVDIKRLTQLYLSFLDQACQDLLRMSYFQEMDLEEIAYRLGLKNARSASDKKYNCLRKLKNKLKEQKTAPHE